jgi:hypothetical protein
MHTTFASASRSAEPIQQRKPAPVSGNGDATTRELSFGPLRWRLLLFALQAAVLAAVYAHETAHPGVLERSALFAGVVRRGGGGDPARSHRHTHRDGPTADERARRRALASANSSAPAPARPADQLPCDIHEQHPWSVDGLVARGIFTAQDLEASVNNKTGAERDGCPEGYVADKNNMGPGMEGGQEKGGWCFQDDFAEDNWGIKEMWNCAGSVEYYIGRFMGIYALGGSIAVFACVANTVTLMGVLISGTSDTTSWLIAAQTLTDVLFSYVTTVVFIGVLSEGEWLGGSASCVFVGFVIHLCGCASIVSLDVITGVRYQILVVGSRAMRRISFSSAFLAKLYAAVWAFSLLYALVPYMGDGAYVFHPSGLVCYADTELTFYLIFTCVIICGSGLYMAYAYSTMFFVVAKIVKKSVHGSKKNRKLDKLKKEIKVLKMMATVVVVFWLNWSFAFSQFLVGMTGNQVPPVMSALTALFSITNSAINPLLYASMDKQFRNLIKAGMHKFCAATAATMYNQIRRPVTSVAASTVTSENIDKQEKRQKAKNKNKRKGRVVHNQEMIDDGVDSVADNRSAAELRTMHASSAAGGSSSVAGSGDSPSDESRRSRAANSTLNTAGSGGKSTGFTSQKSSARSSFRGTSSVAPTSSGVSTAADASHWDTQEDSTTSSFATTDVDVNSTVEVSLL